MRITALALGLVLGGTVPLVAQEATPGAPHEGIKVHGHWTIEVRNSDGTLASHHEVENALHAQGKLLLTGLLSGSATAPRWGISLDGACSNVLDCLIVEPSWPGVEQPGRIFKNLAASFFSERIELSGTATAGFDAAIETVSTVTFTPNGNGFFTQKQGLNIPVHVGQIVQVKVVISFS